MYFFFEEYFSIFVLFLISLILSTLILSLSYFFSVQNPDVEKNSIYECGFEPYEDSRNMFNVRFYLIGILFIIFDLEALFLYPWASCLSQLTFFGFWEMIDFLIELIVGFIYVWRVGILEWE